MGSLADLQEYHTPSSLQKDAVASIDALSDDYIAPYDGFVELVMPDVSCFDQARKGRKGYSSFSYEEPG